LEISRLAAIKLWSRTTTVNVQYEPFNGHINTAEQRTIIHQYTALAIDGWDVTFGTARRGLAGTTACPGPSSLFQM